MILTQKNLFQRAGAALLVLLLAAVSVAPLAAQDGGGLTDEETALLDRTVAAVTAANAFTSFELDTRFELSEEWEVRQGDQALDGATNQFTRDEGGTTVLNFGGPNVAHQILVSQELTPHNGPPTAFTLSGEVRLVDSLTYVTAVQTEDTNQPLAVPDGWYEVSGINELQAWPGLGVLIDPNVFLSQSFPSNSQRILLMTPEEAQDFLGQFSTSIISESVQLDGEVAEAIQFNVSMEGVAATGFLLNPDDPITDVILAAVSGDPLVVTVYLDTDGALIGLDFTFEFTAEDVDLGSLPDVPEGITFNITHTQQFSARVSRVNEPLELATVPEALASLTTPAFDPPTLVTDLPDWNDRVFYEVFVRSFYDSDGDGRGDLCGLIEQLDYLNDGDPATTDDLGVTGLWLMPITQSPSYHGYDVTDYWTVEDDYGTNQDFRDLVDAAHERGMVVIVDLVLNHTSNEHPWFIAARQGDPAYENFYIWADQPGDYTSPWGAPVWHASGDRYYYGLFWSGMPDLNYHNPTVTVEMYDIAWYWLEEMGADGFRLDAIRHLYEDGPVLENVPETLVWLENFDEFVHDIQPDALVVGEIWDRSEEIVPYVGERVDVAFEFDLAQATLNAARLGNAIPLLRQVSTVLDLYPPAQYATFLTNHDQNRVINQLAGDEGAARVAASVLLTAPGVPFLYYGEEIGMTGVKPDERIRTPMQWDDSVATSGFSTVMPWKLPQENYKTVNVAAQDDDPASLLNHYRRLVHLRNAHPALRSNALQLVNSSNSGVYACLRYAEDETLLVVVNLSRQAVDDYALSLAESLLAGELDAALLLGDGEARAPQIDEAGGFAGYVPLDSLPPQSSFVIQLQ